jgi:acyl-CoA dehydrogenase
MTEPGTGSDLQGMRTTAKKDGNHYVDQRVEDLYHQRPECRPDPRLRQDRHRMQPAYKGVSIVLVEADREGFKRGRNLDKIGQDAADTSELFFEDVRVPITNCLGAGRQGLHLSDERTAAGTAVDCHFGAQTAAQRVST